MPEWQRIETAPKDGAPFLIWRRGFGEYEIALAWWDAKDPDVWQVKNLPGLGIRRDYLTSRGDNKTSWMPLPGK